MKKSLVKIARHLWALRYLGAEAQAKTMKVSRATIFRYRAELKDTESDLNHVMQAVRIREAIRKGKAKT